MPFTVGDKMFVASFDPIEKWIVCPDCCGKKYLIVTMGDDSHVTVDCAACWRNDWMCCMGGIGYFERAACVKEVSVSGMETTVGETGVSIKYRVGTSNTYNVYDSSEVFSVREEAEKHAAVIAERWNLSQQELLLQKTKPHKTWAQNATYHRGCIRDLERQLARHRAKLTVAEELAREAKKEPAP